MEVNARYVTLAAGLLVSHCDFFFFFVDNDLSTKKARVRQFSHILLADCFLF